MATCVGCGAELAPTWKYCIHCGIATDAHEVAPAKSPEEPQTGTQTGSRLRLKTAGLVTVAVIAFIVVATVLVVVIVLMTGGSR